MPPESPPCPSPAAGQHERILYVLDRLLHDTAFRTAFAEEGPTSPRLALDEDLIPSFSRVDVHELALVGRNIRSRVVSGGTGTGVGLSGAFPRTLEALGERRGLSANAVAEVFLASPAYQDFRDVPYSPKGRGATLPECFHRYLAGRPDALDPDGELEPLAHYEAAAAIARAVATGADATFAVTLPSSAFHGSTFHAFRAYTSAPASWGLRPTMFLAGAGRCVTGPASPVLSASIVAVLDGEDDALDPDVRRSLHDRLRAWGLR